VHLNRNFVGKNYDAIGWLASYPDSTNTASKVISPVLGNSVQFQAISQTYLDKKAADAKKILDDAKKKVDDADKALQDATAAADAAKKTASDLATSSKTITEKAALDKAAADKALLDAAAAQAVAKLALANAIKDAAALATVYDSTF
jgi:hypothetical protein